MKKYKVVAFDVDGTLIKETCWEIIHRHFKIPWEDTQRNIEEYCDGKINFPQLMRREIELWKIRGELPCIGEVQRALQYYTLIRNAKEAVNKLKKEGYTVILVTYGLDILAEKIAKEIGADRVFANSLKLDGEGRLTGDQVTRVALGRKSEILSEISREMDVPLSQFVVVGDSKYDLDMFKIAGLRIALNPKDEEIRKAADIVVETEDLNDLLSTLTVHISRG
ncbi:MAG: HAD family phosphatase [Candidatus Bathyarchaeia archaeon]